MSFAVTKYLSSKINQCNMRVWMGFSVKCYLALFLKFSVKICKVLMFSVLKKLTVKYLNVLEQ